MSDAKFVYFCKGWKKARGCKIEHAVAVAYKIPHADNGSTPVTANDLRGVIATAAVRSDALHTAYRALKAQVQAAETVEDVNNITWPED